MRAQIMLRSLMEDESFLPFHIFLYIYEKSKMKIAISGRLQSSLGLGSESVGPTVYAGKSRLGEGEL
jgi:uncharacterized SAM-binding protein YcdF (DUF218 family)